MATKYTLTTAFTAITETSGTIQNVGNESVELASSTNAVAGEGIVLNPGEKRSFKGTLSARSIGDAGADVNVVDFTEAGEGGEEYVLPIASDTTLGGVKISNSFTVTNDGTLSIKKSGKTILGAVKSSDDEGKVSVNNDGTMTYNPLGYRQPSTVYTVGNMKYHSALPTGWYLECTTAGTSGSGDLTISSPSIGGTVSDGTVVWTVNAQQNVLHQVWGQKDDFNQLTQEGVYYLGTADNAPFPNADNVPGRWTCIVSVGRNNTGTPLGYLTQLATQTNINNLPFTVWGRAKAGNKWSQWRCFTTTQDLGYRQPSTAYTAGNIAYHSALPTGYYLECTTAGTTSSGDITPTSTIGGTVSDGTVVWTVKCIQRNLQVKDASSISNIDLDDLTKEGVYHYTNYDVVNNPDSSYWGTLFTTNVISSSSNYITMQLAESASGRLYTRTKTGTGSWSNWLQQEAIVAKSLSTNGYIKYTSGLTCAWYTSGGSQPITIPTKVWEGKDSANRTFIIGY